MTERTESYSKAYSNFKAFKARGTTEWLYVLREHTHLRRKKQQPLNNCRRADILSLPYYFSFIAFNPSSLQKEIICASTYLLASIFFSATLIGGWCVKSIQPLQTFIKCTSHSPRTKFSTQGETD